MKNYLKMISFIVILGVLASSVLIGMDFLTKDRIEANKKLEFQETILTANGTEYNLTNIADIFDELVSVETKEGTSGELLLYTHKETLNVSFTFRGNGLWGDIYGMLTLKPDFKTIVNITILEQQETPGLGAVVAEKAYLSNYQGKKFDPQINITNTPISESDVDQISGATGTSNAFQRILNNVYAEYYLIFKGGGILPEEEQLMKDILIVNGYDLNNDSREIVDIFNSLFIVHVKDELKLYENRSNGTLTYPFESENGFDGFGNIAGPIIGFVILESDFATINKIKVIKHNENMGKDLLTDEQLAKAKGKKFPNIVFVTPDSAVNDNEIDGLSGVSTTTSVLTKALNESYNMINLAFKDNDFINQETIMKYMILSANQIAIDSRPIDVIFNDNFTSQTKEDLTLYQKINDNKYIITFKSVDGFGGFGNIAGPIVGFVVLESNFKTINKIVVIEQHEYRGEELLRQVNLDKAIGKSFPNIIFVDSATKDNEIDGIAGVTATTNVFTSALNDTYNDFYTKFISSSEIGQEDMEHILISNDIEVGTGIIANIFSENFTTKVSDDLVLYKNINNDNYTYKFSSLDGFDKFGNVAGPIVGFVVLESDFRTIKKINVIEEHEYRGEELLRQENLDKAIGKKFPNIVFIANPVEDNEVDGISGVTVTTNVFTTALNNTYDIYYSAFISTNTATNDEMNNIIDVNGLMVVGENTKVFFDKNFRSQNTDGLTLYTNVNDGSFTYNFESENGFDKFGNVPGPIIGFVVLEADFVTIKKITVVEQHEYRGEELLRQINLDKAIGKKFPNIVFVTSSTQDNEVDGIAGVTVKLTYLQQH